jgi:hypothetical protein
LGGKSDKGREFEP